MSTAIVVQDKKAIVEYSEEQVSLVRDTIAKGCTELELKLFLQVAKIKRLDPFTGQIRPMKRWDSALGREAMTVQTGIDGYRVIASRTGELAGSDDPVYDSEENEFPKWAKVTVYRWSRDQRIPYTSTARFSEYVQRKKDGAVNSMWSRMPYLMLGKVAEALALRKAFPDELSGIYTFEEMGQAENPEPQAHSGGKAPVTQPKRASEKQLEPAKAETQPVQEAKPKGDGVEVFGGVIQPPMRTGKENSLWMHVMTEGGQKLIVVPQSKVDDDMKVGAVLTCKAAKKNSGKVGDFYEVLAVLENPPEAETYVQESEESVVDAEFEEVGENLDAEPPEGPAPTIEGLKSAGLVMPASEIKKSATIGLNRAKRLYTIAGQKVKTTGFTEEKIKLVLAKMCRLEHLRDLPIESASHFEKFCTGEDDGWKQYIGG